MDDRARSEPPVERWGSPSTESQVVSQTGDLDPVQFELEGDRRRSRWWAFPVLGGIAKLIALIPHLVVLSVLGVFLSPVLTFSYHNTALEQSLRLYTFSLQFRFENDAQGQIVEVTMAGLIFCIAWIPVLISASYPQWCARLVGGYFRWLTRVLAFALGLTDAYPPLSGGGAPPGQRDCPPAGDE